MPVGTALEGSVGRRSGGGLLSFWRECPWFDFQRAGIYMSTGRMVVIVAVFFVWVAYRYVRYSRLSRRRRLYQEKGKILLEQSVTVKEIIRDDGMERVRIFDCAGQGFGAALELRSNEEWVFQYLVGPGAVFDSADAAEREAGTELSWLGSNGRK